MHAAAWHKKHSNVFVQNYPTTVTSDLTKLKNWFTKKNMKLILLDFLIFLDDYKYGKFQKRQFDIWTSAARTGSPRWTGMSRAEPVVPRFLGKIGKKCL